MELGARHVTNSRRPLRTIDDFRGLKIRSQPSEIYLATFRALGTNPVVIDFKDVYLALQQGDIDDNPYSVVHDYRLFQNQKYLSDTSHVLDLVIFVANKQIFMGLQPRQQNAIREAAAIAVAKQRKMASASEAAAFAKLKETEMQFDPLPSETRVALRRATAGVIEDARKRFGAELVDKVLMASGAGTGTGNSH
jgi:TRAP-type transport system periplasmic protein